MLKITHVSSLLILALVLTSPAFAVLDPTSEQIYRAAQSGRLEEAEQMIGQVLHNHPNSGRAHYVAAEVYAEEGRASDAQRELDNAQELAPGLPFAQPGSVTALQRELADERSSEQEVTQAHARTLPAWGMIVVVAGALTLVWFFVRTRRELVGDASF
ncbi:MAG TPA: tetratricopeptide repeat protein [Steroidobacteraceae bacterium]|jgi:predicted Zn-dependent protease|nr:tetratricopeptide repeat protein [Steroidobacteraceae bacterium]